MSADVIHFPAGRRKAVPVAQAVPAVDRLPLAVQAHPGAVALELPDVELWLTADQCRELAADLLKAADSAEGSR